MPTKLEHLLEQHKISRYTFIELLGDRHQQNVWYDKLSGKRKLSQNDLDAINATLQKLGIKDTARVITDIKYTSV